MLLQPITVPFSKSTLKPSVYTLSYAYITKQPVVNFLKIKDGKFTTFSLLIMFDKDS